MTIAAFKSPGNESASPARTGEAPLEPAAIEQVRRRLADHKDARGYSEAELAANISKRTGATLSASSVGNFLRNKYGADEGELARRIAVYLEDEEQRLAIGGKLPFVRTSVAREIERAVLIAEKTGMIAIISTAAGFGKTSTLAHLRAERNSVYISATDELSAPWTLRMELVYRLGGVTKRALPTREVVKMLVRRNRPTIFVDEAQKVDLKRVDELRCIADQAQCPLVLSGNEEVYERAESAAAAHAQYTSRVIARVHFDSEKTKAADVRLIASQIVDKDAVDASLDVLLAAAKREGTFRTVKCVLEVAKINFDTTSPSRKQVLEALAYVKGASFV
ncbi:MAG TPA: AAA family ATPase [Thermoanaerobaculia bacterium]|jgi:DNA transposition AAA+ family ATPase|nr:AAA family ATPase [Thermoanaerobaculia bacterium]